MSDFQDSDHSVNAANELLIGQPLTRVHLTYKATIMGSPIKIAQKIGQPTKNGFPTIKTLWKTADCVCFDVDSTVCTDEAIDELASFLGVGDKVTIL